jgi:3-hydroxyisobutyrate dehydrogenase
MKIGYVGVGHMGGAIASALAASHMVRVFDPSAAAMARCVEAGAIACDSAAAVAAGSDTIFLCLPSLAHVVALLDEGSEMIRAAAPGTVIVDQSTSDPVVIADIAARLAVRGLALLDAPVSGGPQGVAQRTITVMIGGTSAQFDHVAAILRCVTDKLFHTGPVGSAMMTKVANNYLAALQAAASLQTMAMAVKFGCDPAVTADVLLQSSGGNYYIRRFLKDLIATGQLEMGATIEVMQKDVALALETAATLGTPLVGERALPDLIADCVAQHGKQASYNAIALTVSDAAEVHFLGGGSAD